MTIRIAIVDTSIGTIPAHYHKRLLDDLYRQCEAAGLCVSLHSGPGPWFHIVSSAEGSRR